MRLFNRISLATPESVELEFTLAGIGNRTLALLIDYHVLLAILTVFWILWTVFSLGLFSYLESIKVESGSLWLWLLAIALLANFAIYVGYFVFFETLWRGQTPGKRFAKIRVIRDNGRPIGLSHAALRALLRPVDEFLFIGIWFILLGRQEKRIGDWVAGTLVIQEQRGDRKQQFLLSDSAKQLATQLATLTDLDQLLPDDFAIVREYLQRRNGMDAKARTDLSLQLARQLRTLIHLETIPTGTTSEQFLEAIYLAYQHHFSHDYRNP